MRLHGMILCALLVLAVGASAEVINGDFENGGDGWDVNVPGDWYQEFRAAGGNPGGYAWIMSAFGGEGDTGCISQTFVCGTDPDATCTIELDYRHEAIDASPYAGFIQIVVDGNVEYRSEPSEYGEGWTHVVIEVPCGTHTLDLCLDVVEFNSGWEACFDNVTATCDDGVPVESSAWSTVKGSY